MLLISGIALLLFGGKKLPEMMRGMGKGVREFKEGMNDVTKPEEDSAKENPEDLDKENPEANDETEEKGQ